MRQKNKPTAANEGGCAIFSWTIIPQEKDSPIIAMGKLGWDITQSKEQFTF